MKVLHGVEEKEATEYFDKAILIAKKATCTRSKCGAVIIKDREIIGKGYNSPPNEQESQRRCINNKESYHKKVTDKTCCVHAEQRAIINALKQNANKINGSKLYFIRLDEKNNPKKAGEPYCTICSKIALDSGIKEFILWHEQGITSYETGEYNIKSYNYSY